MTYPAKNETLDLQGLTIKADDIILSGGNPISFSRYKADSTGVQDVTDRLVEAINEAASQHTTLVIPYGESGQYRIKKEHIVFSGLSSFAVHCEPGVTIVDEGRLVNRADSGTMRLPWGIEFNNCSDFSWTGGVFKITGSSLGGSSTGAFDANNYEERNPLLWIVDSTKVRLKGIGHYGNPGRGITLFTGYPTDPAEVAAIATRSAFFNAVGCTDIHREDSYLVGDTCSMEQVTFANCEVVRWRGERSISAGNNFASLGKLIRVNKAFVGDFYVVDTGSGSLVDFIGNDILYSDCRLIYPNGKAWDISHEWRGANSPCRNFRAVNINTTGRGPNNASGNSTQEQVEQAPITDYVIENCRYEIGREVFSTDYAPIVQTVIDYTSINDYFINSCPFGRSFSYDGGTGVVRVINPRMEWTLPAGSLAQQRRQALTMGLVQWFNVNWLQNASLAGSNQGLASFAFGKDSDAPVGSKHVFYGGKVQDASWSISANTIVELYGVELVDFAWTGSGTLIAHNCTLDGVPFNTVPTEYADDSAAASGGVPVGGTYRTGSALKIRVS